MKRFASSILIGVCLFWWFRFSADIWNTYQAQSGPSFASGLSASSISKITNKKEGIRRPLHTKNKAFDLAISSRDLDNFIAVFQTSHIQYQFVSKTPTTLFLLRSPPLIRS